MLNNPKILLLGFISLFTDISSEMLFPILPIYLTQIGFGSTLIGVMEGFAEAIVSLTKGYFGYQSDQSGKRAPFIKLGYLLSNLSRPLIGFTTYVPLVFFQRLSDRFGKGVRTAARDAMLTELSDSSNRGAIFGFHRMMDTTGAIIGPMLAIYILSLFPNDYKIVFVFAFIPGLITMLLLYKLKDDKSTPKNTKHITLFEKFNYWQRSSDEYKRVSLLIYFYSFLGSSQMFVLLMLKNHGFTDIEILWAYVFFNVIYALGAYPMGKVADKKGSDFVFTLGIFFLMFGHFSLLLINSLLGLWLVMILFGFSFACTEGTGKSWISHHAPKEEMGAALGTMGAFVGLSTLTGNIFTGIIWDTLGAHTNFLISGVGLLILLLVKFIFTNRTVN